MKDAIEEEEEVDGGEKGIEGAEGSESESDEEEMVLTKIKEESRGRGKISGSNPATGGR